MCWSPPPRTAWRPGTSSTGCCGAVSRAGAPGPVADRGAKRDASLTRHDPPPPFLLSAAALLPLPLVARRFHRFALEALDPGLLRALAATILPAELGAAGPKRSVAEFERWLAGYREGAESCTATAAARSATRAQPGPQVVGAAGRAGRDARKTRRGPFVSLGKAARGAGAGGVERHLAGRAPTHRSRPHHRGGLLAHSIRRSRPTISAIAPGSARKPAGRSPRRPATLPLAPRS
jgi:hypothetical protein